MKILYDGTVLRYGVYKDTCRSGIFVVASEILRALLKNGVQVGITSEPETIEGMKAYLAQDPSMSGVRIVGLEGHFLERAYVWLEAHGIVPERRKGMVRQCLWFPYRLVRKILLCTLAQLQPFLFQRSKTVLIQKFRSYDGFLSPIYKASPLVKASGLSRYTIIYDALPLLFPHFFKDLPQPWVKELLEGFDEDDHCFSISQATRRDCLRFAPRLKSENVKVIPLAAADRFHPCHDAGDIDHVLRKYGVPTGRPYFLSLCSIEPRKNLPFAIRAFAKIAKERSDLLFVLAGGRWNGYSAEMEKALATLGDLCDRVVFTGYVDDEDLSPLYSGATAFVYLSLYEGFGLPPLEAMQCGCPVLTSNTSSLPEVVGDAAIVVPPTDLDAAISAMSKLANDEKLRETLKKSGLARSKLFSWEKAAEIIASTIMAAK